MIKKRAEARFEGLAVSSGIAIGPAHVREHGSLDVPEYKVDASKLAAERKRLVAAVTLARRQIRRLQRRTPENAIGEEMNVLFDAYLQMLKDSRLLRGTHERIDRGHLNAEAALQSELHAITSAFQAMEDAYIAARVDDVREVGNRILRNLMREPVKPFSLAEPGSLIIADQMSPADTAQLDPARIFGAATEFGGAEGHTAILARALGLPMVLGVPHLLDLVEPGDPVIIDGTRGVVVVNPTKRTLAVYERLKAEDAKEAAHFAGMRKLPTITRDDIQVRLFANVELPIEMDMVKRNGAAGVGLLRTEFLFMNRDDVPDEEEQYEALRDIVGAMEGAPVTIRTLDVGGDKPAKAILGDLTEDATSALGVRGIRLSLARADLLETQFLASLRAAEHGQIRLLLPMVSSVSELKQAREILAKAAKKLKRRKMHVPDPLPPLGVMIEVPGAALAADALAQAADFFAIGSNDLTMYTLATDRGNEHVAHLYDSLHPAVLRLIQFSAQAALRARIPVSVCGEIAGDPRYTPLLLGLGFRELSMVAHSIPRVKQRIREMDGQAAMHRADAIMDQVDPGRIAMLLDDFNALA